MGMFWVLMGMPWVLIGICLGMYSSANSTYAKTHALGIDGHLSGHVLRCIHITNSTSNMRQKNKFWILPVKFCVYGDVPILEHGFKRCVGVCN